MLILHGTVCIRYTQCGSDFVKQTFNDIYADSNKNVFKSPACFCILAHINTDKGPSSANHLQEMFSIIPVMLCCCVYSLHNGSRPYQLCKYMCQYIVCFIGNTCNLIHVIIHGYSIGFT